MRIVSQDGDADFPYEQCILFIFGNKVHIAIPCMRKTFTLGEYSSEEKAERALEMCRETYLYTKSNEDVPPKIFMFPKDDEVDV